jgi:hypothetical protein
MDEEEFPPPDDATGPDLNIIRVIRKEDRWYVVHHFPIGPFSTRKTAIDLADALVAALRELGLPAIWYVSSESAPNLGAEVQKIEDAA